VNTDIITSFRIGEATVQIIPEHEGNPMPLSVAMPAVTPEDLRRAGNWLQDPAFGPTPEQSVLNLSWHAYVVRVAGRTVMVDTGLGNEKDRPEMIAFAAGRSTDVLGRLRDAGICAEDVDLVICTHLHFDHVGWNTVLKDGRWVPTFPAARYVFTRSDYEFFRVASERDPVSGPAFGDSVQPIVEAGLADLVDPGHVLIEDAQTRLWLEDAAGHSPGSVIVRLHSSSSEAVFSGDLIHHPVQLVRPGAINLAMEHHPEKAAATRIRVVESLADSGIAVFPAHFTGSPGGRILRDGPGFRWEALSSEPNPTTDAEASQATSIIDTKDMTSS
jgi:glyoxylase-like metal-dependent hydrolase (beta-lactamase superfamily II)